MCFDIENFYLITPLGRPEYIIIQLSKIPQEFIEEYNLIIFSHKGWFFFWNLMWMLRIPSVWNYGKQATNNEPGKEG